MGHLDIGKESSDDRLASLGFRHESPASGSEMSRQTFCVLKETPFPPPNVGVRCPERVVCTYSLVEAVAKKRLMIGLLHRPCADCSGVNVIYSFQ